MEEENTTEEEFELKLSDMVNVINLIDMCSQRGVFLGEELEAVGRVRSRFKRFVDIHNPPEGIFTHENEDDSDETE